MTRVTTKTNESFSVNLRVDYIKACMHHMSKELTRYYLNGVHIKSFNGQVVTYAATDGHSLLVCHEVNEEAVDGMDIIIPAPIVKMIKANKDLPERIRITFDNATNTVAGTSYLPSFEPIDGSFPDFVRVIPRVIDNELFNPINPDILVTFGKSAKELQQKRSSPAKFLTYPGATAVTTRIHEEDDASFRARKKVNSSGGFFVHINEDVIGVAMGMRSDDNEFGAGARTALSNFLKVAVKTDKPVE